MVDCKFNFKIIYIQLLTSDRKYYENQAFTYLFLQFHSKGAV